MKRAAFLVMIITILSKILGFGLEIVLSYLYGASDITDAYLISQTVPTVIFSFVSSGITTTFVPMYSRILAKEGKSGASRYTNNLTNAILMLSTIIVVVVLAFTEPIVMLFASGFSGETLQLAAQFTRITVLGVYFTGLLGVYGGFLRIHGNHLIPASVAVPSNLIIIGSLFVGARSNIYWLAIGVFLAALAQLLFFLPFVHKSGHRYQPVLDLNDEHMKKMAIMAIPVILGTSVNEINVLVSRSLASGLAVGGISALTYAGRVTGFIKALFVLSITTVLYPIISKMAASENIKGLKAAISEAMSIVNLLVVPAVIGCMVFSREIVVLLFGRGAFSAEAIDMTANALLYYSIGMIGYGITAVLTRAFYALQDTRTPMINATISLVLNIVLNLTLARYLGLSGLALATSIAGTGGAILMFFSIGRRVGGLGLKGIALSSVKIGFASVLMGLVALWSFGAFGRVLTQNLAFVAAVGVAAVSYSILIYFMRIPEVEQMINALKQKIGKRASG
jgi:putative peptidoglycan lipid II flippase